MYPRKRSKRESWYETIFSTAYDWDCWIQICAARCDEFRKPVVKFETSSFAYYFRASKYNVRDGSDRQEVPETVIGERAPSLGLQYLSCLHERSSTAPSFASKLQPEMWSADWVLCCHPMCQCDVCGLFGRNLNSEDSRTRFTGYRWLHLQGARSINTVLHHATDDAQVMT